MKFSEVSRAGAMFCLLLGFGVVLLAGCDKKDPSVQELEERLADLETAVVASRSWLAYRDDSGVVRAARGHQAIISIGGASTSSIMGVGGPLPRSYFGEDSYIVQERFEEETIGVDFGAALALYEGKVAVPMVGHSGALLAVGAPEANNGSGAVFLFRIGSEGLWLQAKLTPDDEQTQGFGSKVAFLTSPQGAEYLVVQSEVRAVEESYDILDFLHFG